MTLVYQWVILMKAESEQQDDSGMILKDNEGGKTISSEFTELHGKPGHPLCRHRGQDVHRAHMSHVYITFSWGSKGEVLKDLLYRKGGMGVGQ